MMSIEESNILQITWVLEEGTVWIKKVIEKYFYLYIWKGLTFCFVFNLANIKNDSAEQNFKIKINIFKLCLNHFTVVLADETGII